MSSTIRTSTPCGENRQVSSNEICLFSDIPGNQNWFMNAGCEGCPRMYVRRADNRIADLLRTGGVKIVPCDKQMSATFHEYSQRIRSSDAEKTTCQALADTVTPSGALSALTIAVRAIWDNYSPNAKNSDANLQDLDKKIAKALYAVQLETVNPISLTRTGFQSERITAARSDIANSILDLHADDEGRLLSLVDMDIAAEMGQLPRVEMPSRGETVYQPPLFEI